MMEDGSGITNEVDRCRIIVGHDDAAAALTILSCLYLRRNSQSYLNPFPIQHPQLLLKLFRHQHAPRTTTFENPESPHARTQPASAEPPSTARENRCLPHGPSHCHPPLQTNLHSTPMPVQSERNRKQRLSSTTLPVCTEFTAGHKHVGRRLSHVVDILNEK